LSYERTTTNFFQNCAPALCAGEMFCSPNTKLLQRFAGELPEGAKTI